MRSFMRINKAKTTNTAGVVGVILDKLNALLRIVLVCSYRES